MKEVMEEDLRVRYPSLFRDLEYIECLDGWFYIISDLCEELNQIVSDNIHIDPSFGEVKFEQVKQKFGGLRVYMVGDGIPEISSAIRKAEYLSYKTCEVCGIPGKQETIRGWVFTLCEEHKNKYLNQNT